MILTMVSTMIFLFYDSKEKDKMHRNREMVFCRTENFWIANQKLSRVTGNLTELKTVLVNYISGKLNYVQNIATYRMSKSTNTQH